VRIEAAGSNLPWNVCDAQIKRRWATLGQDLGVRG